MSTPTHSKDMPIRFTDYLDSLSLSDVAYRRAVRIYELFESFSSDEITDIFITNRERDGKIIFDNMWGFTNNGSFEAHDFLNNTMIDYCILKNQIVRWEIKFSKDFNYPDNDLKNFNLNDPSYMKSDFVHDNNALFFNFELDYPISGDLTAMGKNCMHALHILNKHIVGNVRNLP